MRSNKVIGLSLASIMLVSHSAAAMDLGSKAESAKAVPVYANLPLQEEVNVAAAKEMKTESGLVHYNVRVPGVQGLKDTVYQEQLNYIIMSHAMKDIKNVETQAEELSEKAANEGRQFRPYEIFINFDVKSKDEVLSFTVTTYTMTGGANGITRVDSYNIDTKQSKRLELKDLFKAGADYKTVVNREISAQIAAQKELESKPYFDGKNGFSTISDSQSFYIQDGHLVIVFPKYSIAPGVMGIPEFKIPLASLNGIRQNPEPLIVDGTYYNYKYNFKFKIPPLWQGKIAVEEKYDTAGENGKVDFRYVPQEAGSESTNLVSIDVVNTGDYKEADKGSSSSPVYKIAETEAYVYLVTIHPSNPYAPESEAGKEYRRFNAALDGVDDLFKVVDVKQELGKQPEKPSVEASVFDKVIIDGKEMTLHKKIYITEKEVVMIPLRPIAEALGYTVTWNDEDQSVELSKEAQWARLKLGEDNYSFAKMLVKLGTAPEIKDGSTYVPLDFAVKILKAHVTVSDNGIIAIEHNK